jgi:hypothetical protein
MEVALFLMLIQGEMPTFLLQKFLLKRTLQIKK